MTSPNLVVVGTRPEAIKLAPVILELEMRRMPVQVVLTGQHEHEKITPILSSIGVSSSVLYRGGYENRQGVTESVGELIDCVADVVRARKPRSVIVQGDTASTFAGALAGFLQNIPVAHVEAGLRTHDLENPFPEEGFRQAVARWTRLHLCPTELAASHLEQENVQHRNVVVTGNTGIDALRIVAQGLGDLEVENSVLFTLHRRESWGGKMVTVLRNMRDVTKAHPETKFVLVRHPNRANGDMMEKAMVGSPNVAVVPPLPYEQMVRTLKKCRGLMTDSGGLQEEALALGIPTLVLRQTTERPEVLEDGCARLVGNDGEGIAEELEIMLKGQRACRNEFRATKIGDGFASVRVVDALAQQGLCG